MEYLGYGCGLLVLVLAALWLIGQLRSWHAYRRFRSWRIGRPTPARCIRCHGRGWIERQERTLTFTGDGFADADLPSMMCPACGGTGRRDRR